jgi:uncharacterized RDD family membrane protein YckC
MRFFNRILLSTPESVELEFLLAGIGNRTYALLVDYSILMAVFTAFWILSTVFGLGLFSVLEQQGGNYSWASLWIWAIFILLNFLLWNGYFILFETIWQGQTPGKRFAKIRVIRDDGRPIGLVQATLRSLLRSIDDTLFIGMFFILFGKREKRLGDWAAGTIVIQEEAGDRKATLTLSEKGTQLATQLPELANLSQLIPDDYAVVREYLLRRGKMATKARSDKSMELARQLRILMSMETVPPNTTSDDFLEAVYLAYQKQSSQFQKGNE